jgi:uncharacterized cupredoxin-like copper-binding protein
MVVGTLMGAGALAARREAAAHGDKARAKQAPPQQEQQDWGIAGDAKDARRSIDCRMLDTMRFHPERIEVKLDETIRFTAINTGRVLHEFVIGTHEENAAHVPPGRRGQIVWKFNRPGEFEFACLIAGHYEAGMVGKIVVSAA